MDTTIVEHLRASAERLFGGGPILAAYVYGSRVSGRPRPTSDVDVGYYLTGYRAGQLLPLREELRLASALSDAAGLEVDLRNWPTPRSSSEAACSRRERASTRGMMRLASSWSESFSGAITITRTSSSACTRSACARPPPAGSGPDVVDKPKLDQMLSNLRRYLRAPSTMS